MGEKYFEQAYLRYELAKRRYSRAVDRRDEIAMTPRRSNVILRLIEITEEIADRRRRDLDDAKAELQASTNVEDKVYYYTFVKKQKPKYTARMVDYSERHVSRIIKGLEENIEKSLNE